MRCGVGDYTYQLATALTCDSSEIDVAVLTSASAAPVATAPNLSFFPIIETWNWTSLKTVRKLVRDWKPTLIHIQFPTLGYGHHRMPWMLPLYLYVSGLPIVQTWHEIYPLKNLLTSDFLLWFITKAAVPGGLVTVRRNFRDRISPLFRLAFANKIVRFIPNASTIPAVVLTDAERTSVRELYGRTGAKLIVYFGFIQPNKRVHLLFDVADPERCHLAIVGDTFSEADLQKMPKAAREALQEYYARVKQLSTSSRWIGKTTMCGFLPSQEVARVIAAADAVVLPIRGGAGEWNTTVHAAQTQGTFVLTTHENRRGYDFAQNVYFAKETDVEEMKRALDQYAGTHSHDPPAHRPTWRSISDAHIELYREVLQGSRYTPRSHP
jgi:glycosyltransferase involved in cell wall biosynthesis